MSKETGPENIPPEEYSIGELLRTEREKKGISKSSLAEDIKVRKHVIDALENEEWDKLPARVFIKGFIRSYTISIGYDTKKALRLFDKSAPSKGDDSPVPLADGRKKNRTMYYAVPILIILAAAVYLFITRDKVENNIEPLQAVSQTSLPPGDGGPGSGISAEKESAETPVPVEVKKTPVKKLKAQKTTPPAIEEEKAAREEALQTAETAVEEITETATVEETTQQETDIEEEVSAPEAVSAEPPAPTMTLSATVNMETYVRMIVDDNPPKEGVFKPGKNPQWTAERGFEVKVGNAGGIEFVFNGKTFKDLGNIGDVKTFRFPEDFKTNWKEEINLEEE